jgi:hypothetical protein
MPAKERRLRGMRTLLIALLLTACGSSPNEAPAATADSGTVINDDALVADTTPKSCAFTWKAGPALPSGRANGVAFVAKDYLYTLGGIAMFDTLNDVLRAKINADRSLGAWESGGDTLKQGIQDAPVVVINDTVYVIGGATNGAQVDGVYFAKLDASGLIKGWQFFASKLSAGPYRAALTANNEVFVFGGAFAGAITDPWHAKIDMYGHFTDAMLWAGMPKRNGYAQIALLAGRTFHVLGGRTGPSIDLPGTDRHYSISADYTSKDFEGLNGAWKEGTLPVAVTRNGAAATRDALYLIGGMQGAPSAKVFVAPLDDKGAAGAWKEAASLPEPRVDLAAAATETNVYVLGGRREPKGETTNAVFVGGCD